MTRQRVRQFGFGARGARVAAGMTLTELLVSAMVLAMMIGFVAEMLVPARKSIRLAQANIKANSNIRAAANLMRSDFASIDTLGFLAIFVDDGGRYHVILTTVGSYRSLCKGAIGANAARIHLSLAVNPHVTFDMGTPNDTSDDVEARILCRQAILLDPTGAQYGVGEYYFVDEDHENAAAGWYHVPVDWLSTGPNARLAGYMYHMSALKPYKLALHPDGRAPEFLVMANSDTPDPTIPATDLAGIQSLWPVMMSEVTDFKVQWTDGETRRENGKDVLAWYDKGAPKDKDWSSQQAFDKDKLANLLSPSPEFALSPGGYCALWSQANRAEWPKALRILLAVGESQEPYEIIIDMPN